VCATAGNLDPLLQRGWPASFGRLVTCSGLAEKGQAAEVWPEQFPLPMECLDHHGAALSFDIL
jgi:hypothetical protein